MDVGSLAPLAGAVVLMGGFLLHARPQRESIITESTDRAMNIVHKAMEEQDRQITELLERLEAARVQARLDAQSLTLARAELKSATRRHRARDDECTRRIEELVEMVTGLGGDVEELKRRWGSGDGA